MILWHFSCSGVSFHSLLRCSNCCCLLALCEQEKRFDRTSPHLSRVRPWRTESASDIPPLTGEEVRVWVRTGRRIIEGKGVVQGSWRPRYWTGFMLCKVNRIWMDRTCDPLQVLMNEWSVISLLHNVWLWIRVQVILSSGMTFLDHHYIYIYKVWSIFDKKTPVSAHAQVMGLL